MSYITASIRCPREHITLLLEEVNESKWKESFIHYVINTPEDLAFIDGIDFNNKEDLARFLNKGVMRWESHFFYTLMQLKYSIL